MNNYTKPLFAFFGLWILFLSNAAAQAYIYYQPSDTVKTASGGPATTQAVKRTGTFTLTAPGRMFIEASGSGGVETPNDDSDFEFKILDAADDDDHPVDQNFTAGSFPPGEQPYKLRGASDETLPVGNYRWQIITRNDADSSFHYALVTLPDEPPSGLVTAINEVITDYLAADAALRSELLTLINQLQTSLQSQIDTLGSSVTALQNQITALQQSQGAQDTLIAQLQSQLSSLQTQLNSMQASNAALEQRVAALEAAGDPSGSGGGSSTVTQSKQSGLGATDYMIIGGSAAGATALGVGIYSILDGESTPPQDEAIPINEKRYGYPE